MTRQTHWGCDMTRHRPAPLLETYRWQQQAACRGLDVEQFYFTAGERGAKRNKREAAAKAICRQCPVRALCYAYAVQYEDYGIWGGSTPAERQLAREHHAEAD